MNIGMTTKLFRLKNLIFIVLSCAISFCIIEYSRASMSIKTERSIDSYYQNHLQISFDYQSDAKERKKILLELAERYNLSFYSIEYNADHYKTYYFYNSLIPLKTYQIGSLFNGKNVYDVKEWTDDSFTFGNYTLLSNEDLLKVRTELQNYQQIYIYDELGEEHYIEETPLIQDIIIYGLPYYFILFILYVMIQIALFEKKKKEYAIRKIHGFHVLQIYQLELLHNIFVFSLLYWLTSFVWMMMIGYSDNDHLLLFKLSGVMYGFCLLLGIAVDIVYCISIDLLNIKNTIMNKINVVAHQSISMIFKFMTLLFLSFQLTQFIGQTYSYMIQSQEIQKIKELTKNMVIADSFQGDYNISNEKWTKVIDNLTQLVDKEKGIYIDAHNYVDYQQEYGYDPLGYIEKSVRLNENAVALFHIQDRDGNPIVFDLKDRQQNPILLVPENKQDDLGLKKLLHSKVNNYQVLIIKSNQKIYAFKPELANQMNGWIEDAIIVIDGNIDLHRCMIPVEGNDLEASFYDLLIQYHLDPTINIIQPYETFNQQMMSLYNNICQSLFLSLFIIMLTCLVLYQSIMLYFKDQMKRILILKVHGKSFIERYDYYFMIDICLYLLIGTIMAITGNILNVIVVLLIYFINFIILSTYIRYIENKKILAYLKGDDA